jgi:hypothetical protein
MASSDMPSNVELCTWYTLFLVRFLGVESKSRMTVNVTLDQAFKFPHIDVVSQIKKKFYGLNDPLKVFCTLKCSNMLLNTLKYQHKS